MKLRCLFAALGLLLACSVAARADDFSDIQKCPYTYWVPPPAAYGQPPPGAYGYYGPPPGYYAPPPPPPAPPPPVVVLPRFFIGFHFH
ncbi:MAG: hypothetical protein WDO13_09345 [Verrucomicrobiota bacterium]